MPITINGETAIWIYRPEEDSEITNAIYYPEMIEFLRLHEISKLIISSTTQFETNITSKCLYNHEYACQMPKHAIPFYPVQYMCYPVPNLDAFNTGNLIHLELIGMDLSRMPRIPSSVVKLVLTNTTVTNLSEVNVNWSAIRDLELNYNTYLNGQSINIQDGLYWLTINLQKLDIIRFPSSVKNFKTFITTFRKLTGYLPQNIFVCISSESPYVSELRSISQKHGKIQVPIRYYTANYPTVFMPERHREQMKCIKHINDEHQYKIYLEFGSIPYRIKNAYEHRETPIIVAFHLASNIPRRMAEFVTETTIIG